VCLPDAYEQLAQQITHLEVQLKAWHQHNEQSQRVAEIPGVGLLTATALISKVGDAKGYRNGRQLAAS
jgi:transposase